MAFVSRELLSEILYKQQQKYNSNIENNPLNLKNYSGNSGTHNAFYRHPDNYMGIYLIAF